MSALRNILSSQLVRTLMLGCLVFSATVTAQQNSQTQETGPELLDKVYELSGLEQQFVYLGHTFTEEGLRMGRNELPDNEMTRQLLARLEQGLKAKYAPEKLRSSVQVVLERELDAAIIPDIIEVMQGDIWQKAVKLEGRANDPANQSALENYVSVRLQEQLPRQVRLDLIRELVEKTGAVDTTVNMMVSGTLGAAGIMMGESGDVPAQFETSIRDQMTAMRTEYEDMVTRQFLFTYRFMSDDHLTTYVSLYNQPEIQSLNRAVSMALVNALR